eukprot:CAMPEP_0194524872 /NCGR_PEP_ID=MMETSP0253-20130528/60182_1 /TAXON_ID=2966 /ORGANISM="Noctiluca scintillans" /LENGTH=155 /DNA_ID=CAMNT_0039369543 /DNA_START=15 /DNA_END=479 /DNA_ORIENTATION=+
MTLRKRSFVTDLDRYLPPKDAPEGAVRLAHLRLNLPIFAMTAQMPSEAKEARERDVREAQEKEREEQTNREQELKASTKATEKPKASESSEDDDDGLCARNTDAETTAAKHTYDKGYSKWQQFDVEEALREVDKPVAKSVEVDLKQVAKKFATQP